MTGWHSHPRVKAALADKMRERDLHGYVADLFRFNSVPGLIAYHVPNEGKRDGRTGAFMKRMLMVAGVADFAIVIPPARAAFLELKTPKGRTSPEQRTFRSLCEANGTPYAIVRTPEEARAILTEWGAIRPFAERARAAA